MKILFLTRLFHPHSGGVEKHILNLSKELKKANHEITVITENHTGKLKSFEIYKKIKIYRIPTNKNERLKKFSIWKWVIANRSLILKSDVIHAHDVFYWLLPLKILHPTKNVFTTFHGYEGNKTPGVKEKFMHQLAERLSKGTISVGNFYTKYYGTKADVITYGAAKIISTDLTKNKKVTSISFVGRLENETGINEYISAIRLLKDKTNISLKIYGEGSKRREIEKAIKKEKLPITLFGWVSDPEKKISTSDIVFTSRYLGIIEALALGKLVIASYNNQIKKDYLRLTPFSKYILITSSPEEISKYVILYSKNPKKFHNMILKGCKWAKKQTWERLEKQYLKLWNLSDYGS